MCAGDSKAMDEAAVRGMALFKGKARCILCHNGPNFTDNQFHNLGVPQVRAAEGRPGPLQCHQGGEGQGCFQDADAAEHYRDRPYMHDGALKTLEEVVEFLNAGGGANPNLSPLVKPLNLTPEEKTDLVAFLKALTGEPIPFQFPKLPKN